MSAGADPEGTARGRGARFGWEMAFEAPKAPSRDAKGIQSGGEWGEHRPKRISVLSKRHRTPVVETFVIN